MLVLQVHATAPRSTLSLVRYTVQQPWEHSRCAPSIYWTLHLIKLKLHFKTPLFISTPAPEEHLSIFLISLITVGISLSRIRHLPVCDQLISMSTITSSSSVPQCVHFPSKVTQCPIYVHPTLLLHSFIEGHLCWFYVLAPLMHIHIVFLFYTRICYFFRLTFFIRAKLPRTE